MKPVENDRQTVTSGVVADAEFGISLADSAHIMTILRDTLYSDKILAVIREYSANAWDAHRMAGTPDLPILVHIPTHDDLFLRIRDFGPGLSREDVFQVYTQYGASTKRGSNDAVGMLGIGCKSGFAYGDTFSVTSWFGGKKSVYVAMLDESNKGIMNLVHEEDCGVETGVEVELAVKSSDVQHFVSRASKFFKHFNPRPNINIVVDNSTSVSGKLKSGEILSRTYYDSEHVFAIMGCVPYRVDLNQVKDWDEGLNEVFNGICCELFFDIGEVDINASREELKYSDRTKRAIIDKLNELLGEYLAESVRIVSDKTTTDWSKYLACQEVRQFAHLAPPILKKYLAASISISDHVPFTTEKKKSTAWNYQKGTYEEVDVDEKKYLLNMSHHLSVDSNARFVINDNILKKRTLSGYNLAYTDYVVSAVDGTPIDMVEELLQKTIEDAGIEGIPVVKISTLPWTPKPKPPPKPVNVKHGKKMFLYVPKNKTFSYRSRGLGRKRSYVEPASVDWDVVDRVPQDDDVYVMIDRFEATDPRFNRYENDKKIFEHFGLTMPDIYGYKPSEKNIKGITYSEWRRTKNVDAIKGSQGFPQYLELWDHIKSLNHDEGSYFVPREEFVDHFKKVLGEDHEITKFAVERTRVLLGKSHLSYLKDFFVEFFHDTSKLEQTKKARMFLEKYPLLKDIGLLKFFGEGKKFEFAERWVDYIKLVDEKENGNNVELHDDEQDDQPDGEREASHGDGGTVELLSSEGCSPVEGLGGCEEPLDSEPGC